MSSKCFEPEGSSSGRRLYIQLCYGAFYMDLYILPTRLLVRVGKNLSEMFPVRNGLKQGDALSPLLFNFALEYAIKKVQVNQDGLKLNGTRQLLAYADDVNILGGSAHTVKENAEALLVATKEMD